MNLTRKHKIVIFLLAAVACAGSAVYWYSCGRYISHGRRDAVRDLKNGMLRVETCGHIRGWDGEYSHLLLERYGIHLRYVATCVVSDEEAGHLSGYNSLMIPEIKRRFGADILEQTQKEAAARHARHIDELKTQERSAQKQDVPP